MAHFLVSPIRRKFVEKLPLFRYESALFCIVPGAMLNALVQNLNDDQIVLAVQCANLTLVTSRLPRKHIPALLNVFQTEEEKRVFPAPTHPESTEFRTWQSRYNARIIRKPEVMLSVDERLPALFSNEPVTIGDIRHRLKPSRYWNSRIVLALRDLPETINLCLLAEALEKMRDDEQEFIADDAKKTLHALQASREFANFATEEVLCVVRQIIAQHKHRNEPSGTPSPKKYIRSGTTLFRHTKP